MPVGDWSMNTNCQTDTGDLQDLILAIKIFIQVYEAKLKESLLMDIIFQNLFYLKLLLILGKPFSEQDD